ncbi:MAG: MerR family transcriptional regulator [Micromonosporaceae bacterium]|nr:MerR family transcriptional regulator [Micromonosporaceae bacterium]
MDDDVEAISGFWRDAVYGAGEDPGTGVRLLGSGEFSRRSRLSQKALRLYDGLGLLRPARIDPGSGYRRYRETQLATARLIAMLRRLDMPLAQVGALLSTSDPAQRARLLAAYWQGVERRVAAQRELAAHLRVRLSQGDGMTELFDIQIREVPEQLVLTRQRHLLVDALPGWLSTVMPEQDKLARQLGGACGPPFVIFHGEVNQDSDGPVEACTPIDPGREGSVAQPTRREPAHREAYVRLRKAQVAFPQILSAYDAVMQWIGSNGLSHTAAPREVYFTDFQAAGTDDEVCDVAFPIP